MKRALSVLALGLGVAPAALGQEAIRYELSFPSAASHYLDVEASFPAAGEEAIELMMAVWTPGSYLVREYARHVEEVEASTPGGRALPVARSRKNRWKVETSGAERVVVRYRVYCREMTVRTNWVESDFVLLNGAPTFLTLAGGHDLVHEVRLELPSSWSESWTALDPLPGGAVHRYAAESYDVLVDSPIYAGNPEVYPFEVAGVPHYLVNHGEGEVWDGPRSAADVESIVRETHRFWGQLPYDRYVFLNMMTEAGGGLEHRSSTLLMTSRWRSRDPEAYRRWLGLVSHELFHAWNVKRLRPEPLGPFDYENEVHSKSLWVAEGVTSYYDDLLLRRAGLLTQDRYLEALSRQIATLQTTPGRKVRPVELASYDAWIRAYRPDENSRNTTVSYYTKGAVVAFLLDARIRRATGGEKSLDDVMRMAYELYSGERGYTPEEFRAVASEIAGEDLSSWFHRALETTEELDYEEALDWFGLRFEDPEAERAKELGKSEVRARAWLGAETRDEDGRLVVEEVPRVTPAHASGLNVGDEILAVGEYRVLPSGWKDRLELYRPGDEVELLVARRERLLRIPVTFGEKPPKAWKLESDPNAGYQQRKRLEDWLS